MEVHLHPQDLGGNTGQDPGADPSGIFTQMTRRQNFNVTSGMGWTVFLVLSVGHHVKFDTRASNFLTPASKSFPCENPPSGAGRVGGAPGNSDRGAEAGPIGFQGTYPSYMGRSTVHRGSHEVNDTNPQFVLGADSSAVFTLVPSTSKL